MRLSEPEAKALGRAIEAIIPAKSRFWVIYICPDGTVGSLASITNDTRDEIIQEILGGKLLTTGHTLERGSPL